MSGCVSEGFFCKYTREWRVYYIDGEVGLGGLCHRLLSFR